MTLSIIPSSLRRRRATLAAIRASQGESRAANSWGFTNQEPEYPVLHMKAIVKPESRSGRYIVAGAVHAVVAASPFIYNTLALREGAGIKWSLAFAVSMALFLAFLLLGWRAVFRVAAICTGRP